MDVRGVIDREKKLREIAEIVYAENKKKGLAPDSMRDWKQAEEIFDNKIMYYASWLPSQFIRKYYYKIIAVSAAAIVFLLAWNVKMGQDLKEIDDRPYVSVDIINPVLINDAENKNTYFGNYMILRNTGKTPASNVTTKYYLTTDAEKVKSRGQRWVDEKVEGISSLGFIAPRTFVKEPSFRSLSPSAGYYYFEAVVSYQGISSPRRYWTKVKKVFQMEKSSGKFAAVLSDGQWDSNNNFSVPTLSSEKEVDEFITKVKNR